jgi:DNA-binding response OmpR family regulator
MKVLFIDILTETTTTQDLDQKFSVEYTISALVASEKMHLYEYDCIILCCSLIHKDTQKILADIAHMATGSGLIILSKENSVEYKIQVLHAGADDCLAIPYHPQELSARILAIIRRKKFNARDKIHFANIAIDPGTKEVFVWNQPVSLTRKEYEIMLYLVMNRTNTVSQTKLIDYLWGEESENKEAANLLITHIKNLRKKLSLAKAELEIKNIYGVGYRIIEL